MKKTDLTVGGEPVDPQPGDDSAKNSDTAPDSHQDSAPMSGTPTDGSPLTLEQKIINVISTIHDPEIPVNIYELGLIYDIKIDPPGNVNIKMTLTSPNCPVAEELPLEVQKKVQCIAEVTFVYVELVWDPPWTTEMMTEDARLVLGV